MSATPLWLNNRKSLPVTFGVAPEDPALWKFVTQLEVNDDEAKRFVREFDEFFQQLRTTLKHELHALQRMYSDLQHWEIELDAKQAGSTRNLTNLTHADLDIIVVLNNGPGNAVRYDAKTKQAFWPHSKEVIQPAAIVSIINAFHHAVEVLKNSSDMLAFHELERRPNGKCHYKFCSRSEFAFGKVEFDLLPGFVDVTGAYCLLDQSGGNVLVSRNELTAHKMENLAKDFLGLREFIKALKLVSKAEATRNSIIRDAKLSSHLFEILTMTIAEQKGSQWWRNHSFTAITQECLSFLLNLLAQPTPNKSSIDPSWDLLACAKQYRDQVCQFLERWRAIPAASMLAHLEGCLLIVKGGSPETNVGQLIVDSRELSATTNVVVDKHEHTESQLISEKPIHLIEIDEHNRMMITTAGRELLHTLHGKTLSIVGMVGKYRSAKSCFLNRVLYRSYGFAVSALTSGCTHGIWIWGEYMSHDHVLILLDTEGLLDPEKDNPPDIVLFLLTTLLSSMVIMNTEKTIDAGTLEQLHFISKLSKHLRITDSQHGDMALHGFARHLPALVWLIRDFQFNYPSGISNDDEYLESVLLESNKPTTQAKERDMIRTGIKAYFSRRKCFSLKRLDDAVITCQTRVTSYPKLNEVVSYIRENAPKKQLCSPNSDAAVLPVDGDVLLALLEYYVTSINHNETAVFETAWTKAVKQRCESALAKAKSNYASKMAAIQLPLESIDLDRQEEEIALESTKLIDQALVDVVIDKQYFEAFKNMRISSHDVRKRANYEASRTACQSFLESRVTQLLALRGTENTVSIITNIGDYDYSVQLLQNNFDQACRGPAKQECWTSATLTLNTFRNTAQQLFAERQQAAAAAAAAMRAQQQQRTVTPMPRYSPPQATAAIRAQQQRRAVPTQRYYPPQQGERFYPHFIASHREAESVSSSDVEELEECGFTKITDGEPCTRLVPVGEHCWQHQRKRPR